MVLGEPVGGQHVRVLVGGAQLVQIADVVHLRDRIVVHLRQEVLRRRLERLVMLGERAVEDRCEELPLAVRVHDERVDPADPLEGAFLLSRRVWRHRRREVGHVVADPLLFLRVPPDQLLLLAPWLAGGIGRRTVVEDPPVRRPHEPPAVGQVVARLGLLAPQRQVLSLFRIDTGVDPVAARGEPIVPQVAEGLHRLTLLVLELAVLVGYVVGRVPVALLEHQLHRGLLLGPLGLVVPHQVEDLTVLLSLRPFVERLQSAAEVDDERRVRARIARRVHRLHVPLSQSHRVRDRAVLLGRRRRGNEEHLDLARLGIDPRLLPDRRRIGFEEVGADEPLEIAQRLPAHLGLGAINRRVLTHANDPLHLHLVHSDDEVLVGVRVRLLPLGKVVVRIVVVLRRRPSPPGLEQADDELRVVHPEPALRRRLLQVVRQRRVGRLERRRRIPREHVVEGPEVGRTLDVGVAAERDHAAAGASDVPENELEHAE